MLPMNGCKLINGVVCMAKVLLVAGERPNFMKILLVIREMLWYGGFDWHLVHTG